MYHDTYKFHLHFAVKFILHIGKSSSSCGEIHRSDKQSQVIVLFDHPNSFNRLSHHNKKSHIVHIREST